jgi:hypothetical protein
MAATLCKALVSTEAPLGVYGGIVVKRRKEEDIAGILEFAGRDSEDPEFQEWLAEHKARHGGKIRVSKGATGVRVMFAKSADMALWQKRFDDAAKGKKAMAG